MTSPAMDRLVQILNPASEATGNFPQFRKLPLELRHTIWEYVTTHERLLHIKLESPQPSDGTYRVLLEERWAINKLFHVNSDSRCFALDFYRVHLPCVYSYEDRQDEGILYLNPELDILNVEGARYFAQFGHDVWAHDRRHVGLVNLALSVPDRLWGSGAEWKLSIPTPILPLLQQVISRLKKVIFIYPDRKRGLFLERHRDYQDLPWQLYHSGPVMPRVPSFDRLPQDPRGIQSYLKTVYLCSSDPCRRVEDWFTLIKNWGVDYDHEVEYQFIVSYRGCSPDIVDRADAVGWVRGEAERWKARLQREHKRHEDSEKAVMEELESSTIPAFGFWIFPIEALGTLLSSTEGRRRRRRSGPSVSLSEYIPQLCLSHLPG